MNTLEALYLHLYRRRKAQAWQRRVHFEGTAVLSVGNLTAGGTGKTPAVQWLVKTLQAAKISTVVVGRGYGGEFSQAGGVVADGTKTLLTARQAGDEAVLHARDLPGVPVVIGRDRVAAVQTAVEKFAPRAVVLDDGFQYWSLAREFDLVLLDARKPFGNGKLLPVGRLREPKGELLRAGAVLLTRTDAASEFELERTKEEIGGVSNAPIFLSNHRPVSLRNESTGQEQSLRVFESTPVAAASALAGNAAFVQSLEECRATVISTLARRDHHHWREAEVNTFARRARQNGAQAVVTTEKDAVKMRAEWCAPLPLWSLRIELQISDEAGLWQLIKSRVL